MERAAQLKKTGKSVADEQMISSLSMPSAYGYIAARYPSKATPQVLTAAQSIEDVGWYFARAGSFAYRDQSGTPILYTWQAGERTTSLLKAEGYITTGRRDGAVVRQRRGEPDPATVEGLALRLSELRLAGLGREEILKLCQNLLDREGEA